MSSSSSRDFSPLYFAGCPEGLNRHASQMIVNAFRDNKLLFPDHLGVCVYFALPTFCPRNVIGFRMFHNKKAKRQQTANNNDDDDDADNNITATTTDGAAERSDFASSLFLTHPQLQRLLAIRALDWIMISMHEAHELLVPLELELAAARQQRSNDDDDDQRHHGTSSAFSLDDFMMNSYLQHDSSDGVQASEELVLESIAGHTVKNSTVMAPRRKDAQTTKAGPADTREEHYTPHENIACEVVKDKLINPFVRMSSCSSSSSDTTTKAVDEIFTGKLKRLTETCIEEYNLGGSRGDDDSSHRYSNTVLLCRVSGERLSKRQNFNSAELAKVFADYVLGLNYPHWQASMRFYHVEFRVVSDFECCIAGVVLHGPNFPRYEQPPSVAAAMKTVDDVVPLFRIQAEMEKSRVENSFILASMKHQLMLRSATTGEGGINDDDDNNGSNSNNNNNNNNNSNCQSIQHLASSEFAPKVSAPATFRNEIRSIRSEKCNMHQGIAEMLCQIANISKNDIVLDPMAGAGTIGMEAILRGVLHDSDLAASSSSCSSSSSSPCSLSSSQQQLPLAVFTGDIELQDAKVQKANMNRDFILEGVDKVFGPDWTELLQQQQTRQQGLFPIRRKLLSFGMQRCAGGGGINWDATRLPFRDGVIDVIISDLPFGHRCGTKRINQRLYPAFLRECHRVLSSLSPSCTYNGSNNNNSNTNESQQRQPGRAVLLTLERGLMNSTLENLFYNEYLSTASSSASEEHATTTTTNTESMLEGKRISLPKDKESVLKQEEQETQGNKPAGRKAKSNEDANRRPLFILRRPEFCIDMGGLYPYCYELIKN